MVSEQPRIEHRESSGPLPANANTRRNAVPTRALALGLALCVAGLSACVSSPGPSRENVRLAKLLAKLPAPEIEEINDPRPTNVDDHHLHIAGLIECGGFFRKTQTVYAEAWATHPGADGPPVELGDMQLRLDYAGGVFDGLKRKTSGGFAERIHLSDVLKGNFSTDLCGCARFVATAKVPPRNDRLRTRVEVCPDS